MVDANDLIKYVKKTLKDKKFVVAIQREPYIHTRFPSGIQLEKTAGGAHVLLDGILKHTGGLMVAIGAGNADSKVVDEKGRIQVPPDNPTYTLKRIFLKKKELDGFYYGFANQTLWPICHAVFVKPIFSQEWWEQYVAVNEKYAQAIVEEIDSQDTFVWINDYHLALLPKMLKDRAPNLTIGTFWHIPWPTYEIFRVCPWKKQLMEGLLGSDFIGFHRSYHVENFIETARLELEVMVDSEPRTVIHKEHHTKMASLPAGIDYHDIQIELNQIKDVDKSLITKDFGFDYKYLVIGVDRVDYTKGLIERLKIIDKLFETHPELLGQLVYLSVGAPSRIHIPAYKSLHRELFDLIEKINWKYSTYDWQPIHFVNEVIARQKLFAYYKLADACLVTSLDDGMNLVAKEYAICCDQEKGMLVLSKFTGAAKDLKSAISINPYDTQGSSEALFEALTMKKEEKIERNKRMKAAIKEQNIYDWAIKFIQRTVE